MISKKEYKGKAERTLTEQDERPMFEGSSLPRAFVLASALQDAGTSRRGLTVKKPGSIE
jgi:hypothetical protein